jgi:purine nucleoside phosphorylase
VITNFQKSYPQDCLRQDGCYCFVSGPAYESMAESRFLLFVGGDSVGMVRLIYYISILVAVFG